MIFELLRAEHVPKRVRTTLSVLCACLAATVTIRREWEAAVPRDFGQVWFAARAVFQGLDPYALIGPGLEFNWGWPFVYPLTAAIVALPFAPFPEAVASVLFAMLGTGLFAWALMENGYSPLFAFFSLPIQEAAGAAQWSPLMASTFAIAPLAFVLAAKPTIGAALFVARPRKSALVAGVVLIGVSLLVQPTWPLSAASAMRRYRQLVAPTTPFHAIVTYPGGVVALLCLSRWRRSEARLVAALACVPITISHYETVPLLLVPRSFAEVLLFVALGYAHFCMMKLFVQPPWTVQEFVDSAGILFVMTAFLPATVMVLRRPNVGAIPNWLERRISRWPAWLRGSAP